MKQYSALSAQDKAGFVEVPSFTSDASPRSNSPAGNPAAFFSANVNNAATTGREMRSISALMRHVAGCTLGASYNGPILYKRVRSSHPGGETIRPWNLCGSQWGGNGSTNSPTYRITEIVYRDASGNARYYRYTGTDGEALDNDSYRYYTEQTSDARFYVAASTDMTYAASMAVGKAAQRRRRRRRRWWNDDE